MEGEALQRAGQPSAVESKLVVRPVVRRHAAELPFAEAFTRAANVEALSKRRFP